MGNIVVKNAENKNAMTAASSETDDDDDSAIGGLSEPPICCEMNPLDADIVASESNHLKSSSAHQHDAAEALDAFLGKGTAGAHLTAETAHGHLAKPPSALPRLRDQSESTRPATAPVRIHQRRRHDSMGGGASSSSYSSANTASSTSSFDTSSSDDIEAPVLSNGKAGTSDASKVRHDSILSARLPLKSLIKRVCVAGLEPRPKKQFCLSQTEIQDICSASRNLFLKQPTLLKLKAPVKVVGDIHGQFKDLMRILRLGGMPPDVSYLFMGDYVDRGKQSLETITLLLCLKLRFPENIFLLRGNHECASVTKVYGFYDECKRRASLKVWRNFVDVFNTMPIAAIVGERIFCVHGGISPYLGSLSDIEDYKRPSDIPEDGLISDLLWSDPDPQVKEWSDNDRGVSFCFGKRSLDRFCRKFGFDLVVRGHMVVEDGYEFFGGRKLVTVFSAPNYCNDFDNAGAIMNITEDLLCSFQVLEPYESRKKSSHGKSQGVKVSHQALGSRVKAAQSAFA